MTDDETQQSGVRLSSSFASMGRRRFLSGAIAACGAAAAWTALGPVRPALASNPCILYPPGSDELESSEDCRVRFGPPSDSTSCVTVFSPEGTYFLADCCATCLAGCGFTGAQARGAVCDAGACTCTARYY